jgi:hypothetical protein
MWIFFSLGDLQGPELQLDRAAADIVTLDEKLQVDLLV